MGRGRLIVVVASALMILAFIGLPVVSVSEILDELIDESNGSAIVEVKYIYGNEPEHIQQFNLIRNEEGQWKLNFWD